MKLLKKYSYAKINLGLEVLNRREDGYHNIQTVFCRIGLKDELLFEPADNLTVVSDPDIGIPQEQNLIYKAAAAFAGMHGMDLPRVRISVKKNIPNGAGLGGGSSNAATTLLALDEWYDLNLEAREYIRVASRIGSDVPFFLLGGACFATGRGEELSKILFRMSCPVLLVNPGIHVSTPLAYSKLGRTGIYEAKSDFRTALRDYDPNRWNGLIFNDFEPEVFRMHPEIAAIKEQLYAMGALFALMSGSGSSVFGIFKDSRSASDAAAAFSNFFTHISEPEEL